MSTKSVKTLTIPQYQGLLTGLPKYAPNAVFVLSGQSYTTPQVVALINAILAALAAVPTAKGKWVEAVAAAHAVETGNGVTVKQVREVAELMFLNSSSALANLAITPRKAPKPLSAAARAAATAKADATRKARGTTGKKQKALVTGNVTGVTIVPVTTPASAPAAATPAAPLAASGTPPKA